MSGPLRFRHEQSYGPEALRWAWALGLGYNVTHDWPVDLPVAKDAAEHGFRLQLDEARRFLSEDWDVEDRAGLVARLIALGRDGHRYDHRSMVRRLCALPSGAWYRYETADREAIAQGNAGSLQRLWRMWAVQKDLCGCRTASFFAFDAARAAMLSRCGFALGWLGEAEMRGYLFDLAREASASFASWEAYALDFEIGRAFWAGTLEAEPWTEMRARLLGDPRSPWRRLPFAFPETDETRVVTSLDTFEGPYWTLERLGMPAPFAPETVPESVA